MRRLRLRVRRRRQRARAYWVLCVCPWLVQVRRRLTRAHPPRIAVVYGPTPGDLRWCESDELTVQCPYPDCLALDELGVDETTHFLRETIVVLAEGGTVVEVKYDDDDDGDTEFGSTRCRKCQRPVSVPDEWAVEL